MYGISAAVSTLTVFELLTYPGMGLAEEMDLRLIVNNCEHIPVTFKIAERAASLGRTRRRKSLDLFIAASAIEFNLTLFTNNIRDFKNIPGLKVKKI